jgi:hypothetical protein
MEETRNRKIAQVALALGVGGALFFFFGRAFVRLGATR